MAQRPTVPADHWLSGYAEYMLDKVDHIGTLLWCLTAAVAVLAACFAVFAYQKWRERREVREDRTDIRRERDEVRNLLAVIKGWTVVNQSSSDRAVVEVKEEIKAVPDATATKVVEAIAKSTPPNNGDSGVLRTAAEPS